MLRFSYDREKNRAVTRKHGVSLREAREIFDQTHILGQKNDDPEHFRAIGWCGGRLCSVIFGIRHDTEGEYHHLVTAWKATFEEHAQVMAAESRLDVWVPPFFGAASGGPCAFKEEESYAENV